MSLISLRNLAGPFRSKLQMGALVIVVLLVLAIRLGSSRSGGTAELDIPTDPLKASGRPAGNLLNVLREAKQPSQRAPSRASDDLLDELVAEGIQQPPSQEERQRGNSESFEDIRKSLGLE